MVERTKLEGLVLSHSQLDLFGQCPQKWYRRYVLKEPDVIGAPLIMGRAFHKAIEENFLYRLEHGVDLDEAAVVKSFKDRFNDEADKPTYIDLETLTEDKVDWDGEDPKELREQGARAVARYHKQHAPFLEPAEIEQWYQLEVSPGIWLVGVIDLLTTKGSVIDYKLVNYAWRAEKTEMSMQPTCYAALRGGPTRLDFHFITKNKSEKKVGISIRSTKRLQADIDWLLNTHIPQVAFVMSVARDGKTPPEDIEFYFPRSPGMQCHYCPHRRGCGYRYE